MKTFYLLSLVASLLMFGASCVDVHSERPRPTVTTTTVETTREGPLAPPAEVETTRTTRY